MIAKLQKWVSDGLPIAPGLWIDEAMRLNAYYGEESDRLADLENEVARIKWDYMVENDVSDAKAESYKRTTHTYVQFRKQEQKVKMVDEYIRLAKKRATLADSEFKH